MALPQTDPQYYPVTRHESPPLIDLNAKAVRERLSPSAVRAFFNMKNPDRVLDTDRLQRVSYLVGIFKALNVLYSEKLADAWMQRPNSNRIFGGQTPLAYLMKGGLPAMQTVRWLLDARRGG